MAQAQESYQVEAQKHPHERGTETTIIEEDRNIIRRRSILTKEELRLDTITFPNLVLGAEASSRKRN